MQRPESYRDLIAWQKAMVLARDVYALTAGWPAEERFGLIAQARRSAVSIPSNVAEGAGRSGNREFRHCLSVAHGSLCELETQIDLAVSLGFSDPEQGDRIQVQAAEVGRIIRGLIRRLDEGRST